MLLIPFIIFLAMLIAGICVLVFYDDGCLGGIAMTMFGAIVTLGLSIALIVGITTIGTETKIDQQIAIYEEENVKIETAVTNAVEKYLEHEQGVFDSLQGDDITTLVVAYPEIASNELVLKQIKVFVNNNDAIRELKNSKLDIITWKFLIYFGK